MNRRVISLTPVTDNTYSIPKICIDKIYIGKYSIVYHNKTVWPWDILKPRLNVEYRGDIDFKF